MKRNLTRSTLVVAAIACVFAPVLSRASSPTLSEILAASAKYVGDYEKEFASIVSEERYEQTANPRAAGNGPRRRVLKSDLLTFNAGALGWIAFRDVLEVDGVKVADQPQRLVKLVEDPTRSAVEDARRVTDESARFNIGSMKRTINIPTAALMFLRTENLSRSKFEFVGMKPLAKLNVALLSFKETAAARMIQTIDNAPAAGRFWIDPQSGRVVQTELTVASKAYSGKVTVEYADQPSVGVWVPVRMTEQYSVRDDTPMEGLSAAERAVAAVVDGKADYQNFRKFQTKAGLIIK